ncbi:MAG: hypothetical protein R3Y63_11180 [Eubacteriales bacterium]
MRKISRQTNFDSEIKKITQELQHSRKMAKSWNDKVKRREDKLFEVNRLAILDFCAKNSMDYTQLRSVFENLPPVSTIVETPEMTESEIEELFEESTESQEEISDFEVDSSIDGDDFKVDDDNQEREENKEELEKHDNTME